MHIHPMLCDTSKLAYVIQSAVVNQAGRTATHQQSVLTTWDDVTMLMPSAPAGVPAAVLLPLRGQAVRDRRRAERCVHPGSTHGNLRPRRQATEGRNPDSGRESQV